jgi:HlyD family secretion protein
LPAKSASERDFDLAVQQLALARAEAARAQAGSTESQRNVDVASGSLELRKALAMRTALVSPFDGLVIRRLHDPGDPVAVGATVLWVVATDRLWVRAWIDESALGRLAEGQTARVTLPGDRERPVLGRVDRIGREADRQTHEIIVDVLLLEQTARVAIGQRADVRIELGRSAQVARIPLKFVQRDGDTTFCRANRDGRIHRVPVQLGALGATHVEVVSGLKESDTVLEPLKPGTLLPIGRRWKDGS